MIIAFIETFNKMSDEELKNKQTINKVVLLWCMEEFEKYKCSSCYARYVIVLRGIYDMLMIEVLYI